MKLQSFLKESTVADEDISEFMEGLDPKFETQIKDLLKMFSRYKNIGNVDVSDDTMIFHIGNGLVEFDFTFTKEEFTDHGVRSLRPILEFAAMLDSKIVFGADNISEHEYHKIALMSTFVRSFDLANTRYLDYIQLTLGVAKAFEEWYFDISGEVGKRVKLIKITTNLEDGSSNSVWKWTPYLGQFFHDGKDITARTV